MFPRFRSLVLPFLGVLCAGWVVTAAPTPAAERVTVKRADGTSVAGELLWADADGLGVRPTPKADPLLVKWADVKTVSNGLTRQAAVAKWKADRAGRLCPTCNGDRTVKHEACGGTGVDPAAKQACATCNGTGAAGKCTNPKCKDGKVECPGQCLKKSVGNWHDGKRWFKVKGGEHWVSEAHIGQVWVVNPDGVGMTNKGPCPTCQGTTSVNCGTCLGKATLPCKTCNGAGVTGPACKDCDKGQVKCATCKGSGLALVTPAKP